MPVILVIRHGLNDWVGKRLAGRLPGVHLNADGLQQARRLADFLKPQPIKAIFSSPLERAQETAAPLAERSGLPVQLVEGLSEINFGTWQGCTIKQLHRHSLWKTLQTNPETMQFPGGESLPGAQERVVAAMTQIVASLESDAMAACFSHSDAIRLMLAFYLQMPLHHFHRLSVSTAAMSVLRFDQERIKVEVINHSCENFLGGM